MNPFPNISTIPIDGNRLIIKSLENTIRNKLLLMLIRSIVVAAAGNYGRKTIGLNEGSYQLGRYSL